MSNEQPDKVRVMFGHEPHEDAIKGNDATEALENAFSNWIGFGATQINLVRCKKCKTPLIYTGADTLRHEKGLCYDGALA